MASFMSYFSGKRDPKQSARDAIVSLRQQLQIIEKREEFLQKKIDEELRKAKANAVSNKTAATAALRRKMASEAELDRCAGTRMQLELQVNTLESANLNAETMAAMKKAADVLKVIHGGMNMDKVDATIAAVNEQRELANEVAEAISNPMYGNADIDEDELKEQLAELEQDGLNERLAGADHAPIHIPAGTSRVEEPRHRQTSDEEAQEAELKELQAALAM